MSSSTDMATLKRQEITVHAVGYAIALMLTGAAFGLVYWRMLSAGTVLGVVFGLGFAQMIVHFRCFLDIDLRRSARADLQLVLFSTMIIMLMVGGTLVVLFNLRQRMM